MERTIVSPSFSQVVDDLLAGAELAIEEKSERGALQKLRGYFSSLADSTPAKHIFSKAVVEVLDSRFFEVDDRKLLHEVIVSHIDSLYPHTLGQYLTKTMDEVVAELCVRRLLTTPPDDREMHYNDPLVWVAKQAFDSMRVMWPDRLQRFCSIVISMFPNMPLGREEGQWGFRGLLLANATPPESQLISTDGRMVTREIVLPSSPLVNKATVADMDEHKKHAQKRAMGFSLSSHPGLLAIKEQMLNGRH